MSVLPAGRPASPSRKNPPSARPPLAARLGRPDRQRLLQHFLRWRWVVLSTILLATLTIEILELNTVDMRSLAEVLVDGLAAPVVIWLLAVFAAHHNAQRQQRDDGLAQHRDYMRRLAEHRDFDSLTQFLVRFPAALLPVEWASLFIYDHRQARYELAATWQASPRMPRRPDPWGRREFSLPLIYDHLLIGLLRFECPAGQSPSVRQFALMTALSSDLALALALAIADHQKVTEVVRAVRSDERRRLTTEVHNSLAQQLFYLHLGLDRLAGEATQAPGETVQRQLQSMREAAASAYEHVRTELATMRHWEQIDLAEAVRRLASAIAHRANLQVELHVRGQSASLSPDTCERIYGLCSEALNNIVKHACAQHVQLTLVWSADDLTISIADDGVGFSPAPTLSAGHYGLALMREALEGLRGVLSVDSAPGRGTRVQATIPLRQIEPAVRDWLPVREATSGTLAATPPAGLDRR